MDHVKSEQTKNMTIEELQAFQKKIENMTPEELLNFRNSFDPDVMGSWGKESI